MSTDVMYRDEWFSVDHLKWARLWLLVGALLITSIFYLSLTSSSLPIPKFRHVDKVMHFVAYAVLMGWFIQIYHNRHGRVIIAGCFIAMGIGIEFLQGMHPKRQFDVIDMFANTGGVIIALVAGFTWLDSILVWLEKSWLHVSGNS